MPTSKLSAADQLKAPFDPNREVKVDQAARPSVVANLAVQRSLKPMDPAEYEAAMRDLQDSFLEDQDPGYRPKSLNELLATGIWHAGGLAQLAQAEQNAIARTAAERATNPPTAPLADAGEAAAPSDGTPTPV